MGIAIAIFLTTLVFVTGGLDVIKSTRNPRPLMDNDDTRFADIEKVKTRSIFNAEVI